jgi:hypothetical protein
MLISLNLPGGCDMTRLIAAAALLIATAAPVLACDFNKSASTDTHSTAAASNGKLVQHGRS